MGTRSHPLHERHGEGGHVLRDRDPQTETIVLRVHRGEPYRAARSRASEPPTPGRRRRRRRARLRSPATCHDREDALTLPPRGPSGVEIAATDTYRGLDVETQVGVEISIWPAGISSEPWFRAELALLHKAALLHHPNIRRVFEVGEHRGPGLRRRRAPGRRASRPRDHEGATGTGFPPRDRAPARGSDRLAAHLFEQFHGAQAQPRSFSWAPSFARIVDLVAVSPGARGGARPRPGAGCLSGGRRAEEQPAAGWEGCSRRSARRSWRRRR